MSDSAAEWQKVKRETKRDAFVARYSHPFLIRRRLVQTMGVPTEVTDDAWTERIAFETSVVDPSAVPVTVPDGGRLKGARIVAVVKAPGSPFQDRISVGRAQNCDVVLRDTSVSKLHAHFRPLGPSEAELCDVKSANGTSVNGRRLVPGKPVRVTSGDTIIFGGVAVQLVDARRLYDLL